MARIVYKGRLFKLCEPPTCAIMVRASFLLLVAAALVAACPEDDHAHGHDAHLHKRAFPQAPLTPPSRPLTWGDVNIIHTTDSHGWLLGHQKASFPEPNYSGDFGDFASFVTHMKAIAKASTQLFGSE